MSTNPSGNAKSGGAEPGAVHRAHGGVLFVDEIASLSLESQQRMLTALQQGELAITGRRGQSSGAMVLTDPVRCDTVLVVAANPEDLSYLHPALRSRLRGCGFELLMADACPRTPEAPGSSPCACASSGGFSHPRGADSRHRT